MPTARRKKRAQYSCQPPVTVYVLVWLSLRGSVTVSLPIFAPLCGWYSPWSAGETSAEIFDDSSPRHPHGCHPRGPALCVNKKSTFLLSMPSQSRCARQLPQRGSPWHFGQLLLFVWVCSVVKQQPPLSLAAVADLGRGARMLFHNAISFSFSTAKTGLPMALPLRELAKPDGFA